MNTRSTAVIGVAVMCSAALGEARAQRLEPQTSIDFIALSGGGTRCTDRIVFEHAIRGASLCSDLATPPTTTIATLFLNEREPQRGNSEAAHERVAERREAKDERRTETPPIDLRPEPRVETPPGDRTIERPVDVSESVVTATPEPATLALVASGLAGLAAYRRRRRGEKGSGTINN